MHYRVTFETKRMHGCTDDVVHRTRRNWVVRFQAKSGCQSFPKSPGGCPMISQFPKLYTPHYELSWKCARKSLLSGEPARGIEDWPHQALPLVLLATAFEGFLFRDDFWEALVPENVAIQDGWAHAPRSSQGDLKGCRRIFAERLRS